MNNDGMHPVLIELMENNIPFTVESDGIKIEGFYKSSGVTLVPRVYGEPLINPANGYFANSRYNQVDEIDDISDLVSLNFEWWDKSKKRWDGWQSPDPLWMNLLVTHNYVVVKTKQVVEISPIRENSQ